MDRYSHILGCLLGTAVGDAAGLRREGLSRQRAERMYGNRPVSPALLFGRGLCSDDTEHTQMVGRALALSGGNVDAFSKHFARQLRCWLLAIPAGVGLATLRACLKLLLGFGPKRSGVFSAGNGPAMRAAVLGVCANSDFQLKQLVHVSTQVTHLDPRAEAGALLVARAARLAITDPAIQPLQFLEQALSETTGEELNRHLTAAIAALKAGKSPQEYADEQGWSRGISGYVNQTVPAALYCWAFSPSDFRQCIENAVRLGGDSDTVAAIVGGICGANLGEHAIPIDWKNSLIEWPRNVAWLEKLAQALAAATEQTLPQSTPAMHWPATVPRNLIFAAIVLMFGFRRILPPY